MNPSPLNMNQQNPSFIPTWLGSVVHAFFGAVFRLGPKRLTWLGSAIYAFLGAVFLLGPYSIAPWLGRVLAARSRALRQPIVNAEIPYSLAKIASDFYYRFTAAIL
jgi:hypothetical protein